MADGSDFLKAILATVKALKIPPTLKPGTASVEEFQKLLAPLESNPDPNHPGLKQIFNDANRKIIDQTGQINAMELPDPQLLMDLTGPLFDAWASFQVNSYLLNLSAKMGFPAPASDFYAPIIPALNAPLHPKPIFVPSPAPPPIVPIPTPNPPAPPPTIPIPPTPTQPPVPPPIVPPPVPPPVVISSGFHYLVAQQNLFAGSGEPSNGLALKSVLGVDSIKVNAFAVVPTGSSNTISWTNNSDPTIIGGTLDLIIDAYQAAGLKVIVDLEVIIADGTPKAQFFPTDTVTFLSNLRILAVQLATAASRKQVKAITIASGLFPSSNTGDAPSQYMLQWRNIYTGCKGAFSGDVLYRASPGNVGPVGGIAAMNWDNCWDAIGVTVFPNIGNTTTAANMKALWETATDTTASYNLPLFGANGWLRKLYTDWAPSGRRIYLSTGIPATPGLAIVPIPPPVPPPVIPVPPPAAPPPIIIPPPPPPAPPASIESPDGTVVTTIGPYITDVLNERFSLISILNGTDVGVAVNGVYDQNSSQVVSLLYLNHIIYHKNTASSWYAKTRASDTWQSVNDPTIVVAPPPGPNPPGPVGPPVPTPGGGNVTASLTSQTGQFVNKEVWGFGTGAMLDNRSSIAGNSTFRASMAKLSPSLLRFNANSGQWMQIFQNPSSPDFTWFDNFFNTNTWLTSNCQLLIGIGPTQDMGGTQGLSASQWAQAFVNTATYFRNKGHECFWWGVGNEVDGGYSSVTAYTAIFNAVADALHNFNSSYKVGGPAYGYLGGWPGLNQWAAASGSRIDFVDIHSYRTGDSLDNNTMYNLASGELNVANARQMIAGTPAANKPIICGEWNASYGNNPAQIGIGGAIYMAMALQNALDADHNFIAGANWDLVSDGTFGSIGPNGSGYDNITPQGYYLGKGGSSMAGNRVSCSTSMSNVKVLTTVSGNTFAIQLTNSTIGGSVQTANVTITGGTPSNVTMWQLSRTSPAGFSNTISSLSGLSIPPESVTIITGTFS